MVLRLLARSYPDWDSVLEAAAREGIFPLVARLLNGPDAPLCPEPVRGRVHRQFLEAAATSVALACELGRVMAHLRAARTPALAFKGPALSVQLYGSPCWRSCEDLDIFVAPHDWPRAQNALRALGYAPDPSPANYAKNELRMFGPAVVDLHRALMPSWCGFRVDFHELYGRAATVNVCGTPVETLCSEDLLLLLCVHAAKHGWTHLKWAADIAVLLRAQPGFDWPTLFRIARRLRAHRRLLVSAGVASRLFEVPLPAPLDEKLRCDPAAQILAAEICSIPPSLREYWPRMRLLIATRDDWHGRLRICLRLARLTLRLTEADRPGGGFLQSCLARPARLLRVHGPAILRVLRSGGFTGSPDAASATPASPARPPR
ncbi:MAG TPA: nucleotidyltransferase family protein [Bryobacteraceae bacterium]|nr:nucleotidyltransferase family protein [Bryobacteraceae bacterium]